MSHPFPFPSLRVLSLLIVMSLFGVAMPAGLTAQDGGNADAAHRCQGEGYLALMREDGTLFANPGECVSYAAQGNALQDRVETPDKCDAPIPTYTQPWDLDLDLSGCDLTSRNLTYRNLQYANLAGANLSGVDLTGTFLIGADLSGANLSGIVLTGGAFNGANLTGADLSGVVLRSTTFEGANLTGANFTGADLIGVYFNNANLGGAIFTDAYLLGVNFSGANLFLAQTGGAVFTESYWNNTVCPTGTNSGPNHDGGPCEGDPGGI